MPNVKTILLSGFEPFGGERVNPSWEAVKALPDQIGGFRIAKVLSPVVFGLSGETVTAAARQLKPDAIICVGQAGGRSAITPEMVAVNLRFAATPDNAGRRPEDEPVVPDGPAAYFSTLPVRAMAESIRRIGVAAAVSYSAGVYVCNDLMYTVLHHCAGTGVRAGFIHVPYMTGQGRDGAPAMPLENITRALEEAIRCLCVTL